MHIRKHLLKNAKESKRTNEELDEHDGVNGIEAVHDDAPESDGEKHNVVHKVKRLPEVVPMPGKRLSPGLHCVFQLQRAAQESP
ncbi:hypothetical protein ElyMa_006084800 [Elysia marginata]|uniref:Uncharacterized protein n=1 Tax=Elysia marginata TaxID=1093978 RepID=A0AAV4GTU8_9GAST|nr:hypothetical protein ElyMa_006084800 [Elysia marginata]